MIYLQYTYQRYYFRIICNKIEKYFLLKINENLRMEYIELISRDTNILAKFVYIICKKTISKLELEKNLEDFY